MDSGSSVLEGPSIDPRPRSLMSEFMPERHGAPPSVCSPHGGAGMSARRSVSRVLSHRLAPMGMAIHLGRRLPDGSCGRPEGWAAHLSPGGLPRAGCALLFGLAPGGVCRVSLRSPARAGGRHRHCGTVPRLATDGRYPPPCAEELGLSSRPSRGCPRRDAQPSDRLADGRILPLLIGGSR
jgi:hypothetical protein